MDITSVGALLGSLKTATEIAKFIRESDLTIAKAETKLKLAELVSALADAKLEAAEVQQAVLERDGKIRDLEREAKLHAELIWKEPCYWRAGSTGTDEPYCQNCYDSAKTVAHLNNDGEGAFHCRVCEKSFLTLERRHKDSASIKNFRRNLSRGLP